MKFYHIQLIASVIFFVYGLYMLTTMIEVYPTVGEWPSKYFCEIIGMFMFSWHFNCQATREMDKKQLKKLINKKPIV